MEKIIVLSRCLNTKKDWSDFHFKGFYKGHEIKRIAIENNDFFVKKHDYILYLEVCDIQDSVLLGKCLKAKNISCDLL